MTFNYHTETDSLCIGLAEGPGTSLREVAHSVVLDFDSEGRLVEVGIDQVSRGGKPG